LGNAIYNAGGTINYNVTANTTFGANDIYFASTGNRFNVDVADGIALTMGANAMTSAAATVIDIVKTGEGEWLLAGDGAGIQAGTTGSLDLRGGNVMLAATGTSTFGNGVSIAVGTTLQLGNNNNGGSLIGSVANAGELIFNRSDSFTFANTITGTSGIVRQSGSGTVTLGGSQAGTLEQTAGTINLAGTWTGSVVQSTGRLTGSGTFTGDANFSGTVAPTGTLAIGGGATFNGATLDIVGRAPNTPAPIAVTGAVTFAGTNAVDRM